MPFAPCCRPRSSRPRAREDCAPRAESGRRHSSRSRPKGVPRSTDQRSGSVRSSARRWCCWRPARAQNRSCARSVAIPRRRRAWHDADWRSRAGASCDVCPSNSASTSRPGLIVLDEEHESTYKQESDPRYETLAAARELARLAGAVVIAGSATPRVATFFQARQGRMHLVELPERVGERVVPTVEVVDLRAELRAGNRSIFSRRLRTLLAETMKRGEQAMLFLNRRGYATVVLCRSCGFVVQCPRCDVPFAWHSPGKLLCHRFRLSRAEPH